jgi:hypothetical protein
MPTSTPSRFDRRRVDGFGRELPDPAWAIDAHAGEPGFRRRILIVPQAGHVRADLEDDFHHFIVDVAHDGETITAVDTGAPRYPWTTCIAAGPFLAERLRGTPIAGAAGFDAQLSHCTHLFDLALLAAANTGEPGPIFYAAFVADPVDGQTRAELRRNGQLVLAWALDGQTILAPSPHAGRSLRALRTWGVDLAPGDREQALILRRAVFLVQGRRFDPNTVGTAAQMTQQRGVCFTYDPARSANSYPIVESKLDFTREAEPPLAARLRELLAR